jgi:hypothetical protein
MPNSIIANSIMGRKNDFPEFFVTEQDVIVCFVMINTFHANIDVNDFNIFWGLKYIPRLFSEYMLTFRAVEPMKICVTN